MKVGGKCLSMISIYLLPDLSYTYDTSKGVMSVMTQSYPLCMFLFNNRGYDIGVGANILILYDIENLLCAPSGSWV